MIDERQQAILDFERLSWTFDEPKDLLIRSRFQCSVDEYYTELAGLIDLPDALEHDPLVVRRLRRLRDRRLDQRIHSANAAGGEAR